LLEEFLAGLDITPHPALVAIQKPSPPEIVTATTICGLFPAEPYLRPVLMPKEGSDGLVS